MHVSNVLRACCKHFYSVDHTVCDQSMSVLSFQLSFLFFLCVHVFLLCCNAFLQCSLHLYHANLFVMMIMMMMLIAVPN